MILSTCTYICFGSSIYANIYAVLICMCIYIKMYLSCVYQGEQHRRRGSSRVGGWLLLRFQRTERPGHRGCRYTHGRTAHRHRQVRCYTMGRMGSFISEFMNVCVYVCMKEPCSALLQRRATAFLRNSSGENIWRPGLSPPILS